MTYVTYPLTIYIASSFRNLHAVERRADAQAE